RTTQRHRFEGSLRPELGHDPHLAPESLHGLVQRESLADRDQLDGLCQQYSSVDNRGEPTDLPSERVLSVCRRGYEYEFPPRVGEWPSVRYGGACGRRRSVRAHEL